MGIVRKSLKDIPVAALLTDMAFFYLVYVIRLWPQATTNFGRPLALHIFSWPKVPA